MLQTTIVKCPKHTNVQPASTGTVRSARLQASVLQANTGMVQLVLILPPVHQANTGMALLA